MGRAGSVVPPPRPELPDLDVPERAALLRLVPVHLLPCQPDGTAGGHGSRVKPARRAGGAGGGGAGGAGPAPPAATTGRSALRRSSHSGAGTGRGAGAGPGS